MIACVYAHTYGSDERQWEPLERHLRDVETLAGQFAAVFGAGELGRLAGLWHDLGKYHPDFQRRLRGEAVQVEHAGAGAALAYEQASFERGAVAFAIAGHHAGLANMTSNNSAMDAGAPDMSRRPLAERLRMNAPVLAAIRGCVPAKILEPDRDGAPVTPLAGQGSSETRARRIELMTRLIFSALVDADRLATARFYARLEGGPTHADLKYDSLPLLLERLRTAQRSLRGDSPVGAIRRRILDACIAAAEHPPGRFSLCAPTGGGKTLSGMRFALEHAVRHGLRRVIVIIPYTSIIEQNARVFRDVLGERNVLEHHSNLDEEKLVGENSELEIRRKLAAENWDSPIVVTTSVQFLESLFSDHPSRCRKLHNIARSVVVLDEVQTLPPSLLHPILDVLGEISEPRIGCSIVLSTATPPALAQRDGFPYGLRDVRPVLPDAVSLADRARRVRVTWDVERPTPYDELAHRLAEHKVVLAIVHRRMDARELAEAVEREVGATGLFHLSALMCPAHRLDIIRRIKEELDAGRPCRVVSTQLVEAGVDLDFPIVYRALAGLDSLAQAAGRCDREGRLTEANRLAGRPGPGGKLVVFEAPTDPPIRVLGKAAALLRRMLANRDGVVDIFDPRVCEEFFEQLYRDESLDLHRVQFHRANLDFLTTAHCFRMIDSDARPVAVPWGEGPERIERFRQNPSRETQRALQPFLVQVNRFHLEAMRAAGVVERVHDRIDILYEHHAGRYSQRYGLDPRADGVVDPEVMSV